MSSTKALVTTQDQFKAAVDKSRARVRNLRKLKPGNAGVEEVNQELIKVGRTTVKNNQALVAALDALELVNQKISKLE